MDEVVEALEIAVKALDQESLTYNLEQAKNLKVDENKYPIVPVARDYLGRIIQARALMDDAMNVVEEKKLILATEYAESFDYNTAQVQAVRCM